MIRNKTIFVLGAGASNEIGMPLGSQLAQSITTKTDIRFDFPDRFIGAGDYDLFSSFRDYVKNAEKAFLSAQKINAGVHLFSSIDDFLNTHFEDRNLVVYGKALIVKSILESEKNSNFYYTPSAEIPWITQSKYSQTWYREIADILFKDIRLSQLDSVFNNVDFVVFNYDRCLEQFMIHATKDAFGISIEESISVCAKMRIFHPYGTPGPLPSIAGPGNGAPFGADIRHLMQRLGIEQTAASIKIYTEQIDSKYIKSIKDAISDANKIIFLGFAYHVQNMELIRPNNNSKIERIFGTAFKMSKQSIMDVSRDLTSFLAKEHQNPLNMAVSLEETMKSRELLQAYSRAIQS